MSSVTYILVHGAWHGAFCWEKVVPVLQSKGHQVVTPDLPGHGNNPSNLLSVTMECYVEAICSIINETNGPIVLVGHSMGGAVITLAFSRLPTKVKSLIYIAGLIPTEGISLRDVTLPLNNSLLTKNLVLSKDDSFMTIKYNKIIEIFYQDCDKKDALKARQRLIRKQPTNPFRTLLQYDHELLQSTRKIYVECLYDNALSIYAQKILCQKLDNLKVIPMKTGHSPFYSKSLELSDILLKYN